MLDVRSSTLTARVSASPRQGAIAHPTRRLVMPKRARTVFATLLATHRQRLALTQAALAGRTESLHYTGAISRAVTERTIIALERITRERPRVPHQATVRALAAALELEPGTPDYDAFIAAAQDPTMPPPAASSLADPDAEFIAAGREPQLARLEAAVANAALGMPSVVLLTGDAGIGKSRMLDEISRRALDRHPGAAVLWGARPRGFGAMTDREPWRTILGQMLRDPFASDGGALPADNARRLDARLPLIARALSGAAASLVGTLVPIGELQRPALLDALPTDLRQRLERERSTASSQPASQEELDAAQIHLLETYASAGPVILVFDDLHWADAATLANVRHLVSALGTYRLPIALLGSIRTGDGSVNQEVASFLAYVSRAFPNAMIDLRSTIGGHAGRAFVDAAVARIQLEPLADRLFERTGGMPLFVMSFLRLHALDGAAMAGRNIPAEIDAVFARQLAHLDEGARSLLVAASVQGDTFLAEPALEVAGLPPDERSSLLDGEMADQVRFDGLQQVAPGATMERYRFVHALLRDHVMDTLSHLERSHLHLATADALERALGPRDHDTIEAIAIHLEQGGDLARAARSWLAAGDRAMLRSDHRHAQTIYRHIREMGLESVAPEVHVQALIGVGNSWRGLGRPAEARQQLQRARREAVRKQLHTIDANALQSLGVLDFDAGRMVAGAARSAQAVAAYTRAGDMVEASRANGNLSLALHGMGRYDDARKRAAEAVALAEQAGSAAALASARIALSNCWLDLGFYERAIGRYEAGLAHNDAHGLIHHGNVCILNLALCHIELGNRDDAERTLARLEDPERRLVERMRSVAAFNGALLAESRGDHDTAWRLFDASRAIRQQLGQAPLLVDSLAGLLRVAVATEDMPTLGDLVVELETRLATLGTIGVEHLGRLHLAMFAGHRALGDETRAASWLSDAVALLRERSDRLSDADHRESYLTRPPSHRHILELARSRGLTVPGTRPG